MWTIPSLKKFNEIWNLLLPLVGRRSSHLIFPLQQQSCEVKFAGRRCNFPARQNQIEAQRKRVRLEKEEQRNERAFAVRRKRGI